MRSFVVVLGVLAVWTVGAAQAGKLDDKLATAGPKALIAQQARRDNVRAVRRSIQTLAARPDVRAVLSGGGQIMVGFVTSPKTHVRAEVYETVSTTLMLKAAASGKRAPRLTLQTLTSQAGDGRVGFKTGIDPSPVEDLTSKELATLAYAKGGSRKAKDRFAKAVELFSLTPEAIADASLINP